MLLLRALRSWAQVFLLNRALRGGYNRCSPVVNHTYRRIRKIVEYHVTITVIIVNIWYQYSGYPEDCFPHEVQCCRSWNPQDLSYCLNEVLMKANDISVVG